MSTSPDKPIKPPPSLPTWTRDHFADWNCDACLFFVAFGDIDLAQPISRSKYRCEGIPEGFDIASYTKKEHGDYLKGFLQGYVWDALLRDDFTLANSVMKSPGCVILHGSQKNPPTLNYLRDAVGLLTHYLDCGACAIYDLQILRWWSPHEWRDEIFKPESPAPHQHTVILVSDESDLLDAPRRGSGGSLSWFHTRGMRKFGRPDLSIHRVAERYQDAVVELCNRFIEYQALGGVIPEGYEVRTKSLPSGGVARHRGSLDDPDFNNVHVEFVWPDFALL